MLHMSVKFIKADSCVSSNQCRNEGSQKTEADTFDHLKVDAYESDYLNLSNYLFHICMKLDHDFDVDEHCSATQS